MLRYDEKSRTGGHGATRPLWVRYEDAVEAPDTVLDRIALYLDTRRDTSNDVDAGRLPVFGSSEFGHDETGDFAKVTVARPDDFNPVGRWKSWPRVTREMFHEIAGNELIELGYRDAMKVKDQLWNFVSGADVPRLFAPDWIQKDLSSFGR